MATEQNFKLGDKVKVAGLDGPPLIITHIHRPDPSGPPLAVCHTPIDYHRVEASVEMLVPVEEPAKPNPASKVPGRSVF